MACFITPLSHGRRWGREQLMTPSGGNPTVQELQYVQGLIERCLHSYFGEREIVAALFEAGVEPAFAAFGLSLLLVGPFSLSHSLVSYHRHSVAVLQKLQDQNPAFFRAYNARLQLKDQVETFNGLVAEQARQMQAQGILPSAATQHAHQAQRPHSHSSPSCAHLVPTSYLTFSSLLICCCSAVLELAAPSAANTATSSKAKAFATVRIASSCHILRPPPPTHRQPTGFFPSLQDDDCNSPTARDRLRARCNRCLDARCRRWSHDPISLIEGGGRRQRSTAPTQTTKKNLQHTTQTHICIVQQEVTVR